MHNRTPLMTMNTNMNKYFLNSGVCCKTIHRLPIKY